MVRFRADAEAAAKGRGYRVQRSRREHAGRMFYLGCRSSSGSPDRIEVDLNFLFRLPPGVLELTSLWQPGDQG